MSFVKNCMFMFGVHMSCLYVCAHVHVCAFGHVCMNLSGWIQACVCAIEDVWSEDTLDVGFYLLPLWDSVSLLLFSTLTDLWTSGSPHVSTSPPYRAAVLKLWVATFFLGGSHIQYPEYQIFTLIYNSK